MAQKGSFINDFLVFNFGSPKFIRGFSFPFPHCFSVMLKNLVWTLNLADLSPGAQSDSYTTEPTFSCE